MDRESDEGGNIDKSGRMKDTAKKNMWKREVLWLVDFYDILAGSTPCLRD